MTLIGLNRTSKSCFVKVNSSTVSRKGVMRIFRRKGKTMKTCLMSPASSEKLSRSGVHALRGSAFRGSEERNWLSSSSSSGGESLYPLSRLMKTGASSLIRTASMPEFVWRGSVYPPLQVNKNRETYRKECTYDPCRYGFYLMPRSAQRNARPPILDPSRKHSWLVAIAKPVTSLLEKVVMLVPKQLCDVKAEVCIGKGGIIVRRSVWRWVLLHVHDGFWKKGRNESFQTWIRLCRFTSVRLPCTI